LIAGILKDSLLDSVGKENRQILDWTKNKNYYKTTIIKWRGSSVG